MNFPTDRANLERVCRVEPTRGSGPGGQHRNKVETGVRVTHLPTGIAVVATNRRSRLQNLDDAFERVAAKLEKLQHVPTPRTATKPTRSSRRRRVADKRHASEKKRERRGGHDD
jgi:protein subunit release factor B